MNTAKGTCSSATSSQAVAPVPLKLSNMTHTINAWPAKLADRARCSKKSLLCVHKKA